KWSNHQSSPEGEPLIAMKDSDILNDILWLAIEDFSGLWEILWDLKSHYPTMPESERKAAALRGVRELLHGNSIELYSCSEPAGEPQNLSGKSGDAALADLRNWVEPVPGAISVRISATDSGRRTLTGDKRTQ
ncbi:MAG: hypothetical protein ABL955_09490, partial [Elusimicrobiota bacterium]